MFRTVSLVGAGLILVTSGIVHGLRTDRWGHPVELNQAVDLLSELPLTLGDWQGQESQTDRQELASMDIAGCIARTYRHPDKGEVMLLAFCGDLARSPCTHPINAT